MAYIVGTEDADLLQGLDEPNQIEGLGGNDTIFGRGWADLLLGGDGDDMLIGLEGADSLSGGEGDDYLVGGPGSDTLDGGAGVDTASFLFAASGITIHLWSPIGTNDGDGARDSLSGIENYVGSQFNDVIAADGQDNVLDGAGGLDQILGLDGNDTLIGGEGDDQLTGGRGNDWLDGGAGNDWAIFSNAAISPAQGVVADLAAGIATQDAFGGWDVLIDIENLMGSNFRSDFLAGDDGANILDGLASSDTLYGRGGNDTLFGGNGDDLLRGGAGDDLLEGGNGALDVADYASASSGVVADLSAWFASDGEGGTDILSTMEGLHGSEFNDLLVGDEEGNILYGAGGDDTLSGGVGTGFGGGDSLVGGSGNDEYRFDRGDGLDYVLEDDATVGNTDVFVFGDAIDHDQLWFAQVDNHLEISVIGTNDRIFIADWYLGSHTHVEEFQAGGRLLVDSAVDELVQAMAPFTPQEPLPPEVAAAIEAAWA